MKLYTSITELKKHKACYDQDEWDDLMEKMGIPHENEEFSICDALEHVKIQDCVWALRTQEYKNYCRFLADVASMVEPIYQKWDSSDKRIQRCISMIYKYSVGLCSKTELKHAANTAVDAAVDAVDAAAYAAAVAAFDTAAVAAVDTAAVDAVDAADAAARAAYAAAYAATYAAAYAATYAAAYAANTRFFIWGKIKSLFVKYFKE